MAVPARLTKQEGRRFAFTVGAAFVVIAGVSAWRGHVLAPRILGSLGVVLLLAGVLVPGRLSRVYAAWMGLATVLSKFVSPVVVGAIYFVILTPAGVLMRLLGKNPLWHREHDGGFWMPVASDGRSDLENQF